MRGSIPKQLFITGTDTGVGKTVVAAILTLGLKAAYCKPIQCGQERDASCVQKLTQLPSKHFLPERYLLKSPLSPHAAAQIEDIIIDLNRLCIPEQGAFPALIIEGCGGVLVPLNSTGDLLVDLMAKWKIPSLIVCRSSLGTINHTLLTIDQLRRHDIPILGVLMNGPKNPGNRDAIETFGHVRVIGELEPQEELTPLTLRNLYFQMFKMFH